MQGRLCYLRGWRHDTMAEQKCSILKQYLEAVKQYLEAVS
nr:MAG TPA: hypothetical protein [Caudoviricetes sp.]